VGHLSRLRLHTDYLHKLTKHKNYIILSVHCNYLSCNTQKTYFIFKGRCSSLLASINVSKQVNINRLASPLRRRRGIFFLNREISYQNSMLQICAHSLRRKTFAPVVMSARRFCQNGASESCQLRLDLVLSKNSLSLT
jgi:hypothetical protein